MESEATTTPKLPPPVAGDRLDVATEAGRVAGYRLGEGRTALLLHSFNAVGAGVELAPLARRLTDHRRMVLVDWLGFGTSERPTAPFGDHPRFTDPSAADALVAANDHLRRATVDASGDLPQLEQPDTTAALVEEFLG